MNRKAPETLRPLFFFVIVLSFLFSGTPGEAIDPSQLYLQKRDAIVVIFNERTDTPEEIRKEEEQMASRPPFFSWKEEERTYFNPPVLTYFLRNNSGVLTVYSTGTGFIISEDGLVVTNAHLVRNSKTMTVELANGETFAADIVGVDAGGDHDIALLKIRENRKFPALSIATNDALYVGKKLVIIGHPYLYKYTLSEATVSKLSTAGLSLRMIQAQTSILPGNSGSPLLDENGQVVGIIFAAVINSETQGLAIPAEKVNAIIKEILARAKNQ